MELNTINKFLRETQPNKKIQLANEIKKENAEMFKKIMQQEIITINNKLYHYNFILKEYRKMAYQD